MISRRMSTRRPLLALVIATALAGPAGCRHAGAPPVPVGPIAAPPPAPSLKVAGVWDWVFRSTDAQGDLRVEMEEWHLEQAGGKVSGFYDRAITVMSKDDRPYRCN